MSIILILYLIDLLSNIDSLLTFIFAAFTALGVIFFIGFMATDGDFNPKGLIKFLYKRSWILIISIIISILIPSQKTMYIMLGTSYLSTSNLPSKVSQALELKIDSVIYDLKKESKDK